MKIICRKCLLSEMDMSETYKDVLEYIAVLPQEQKVSEEVYSERLALCRECASLNDGVCEICGCYVEARAIKKRMGCPAENSRWESQL